MRPIDDFYEVVAAKVVGHLQTLGSVSSANQHWVIVEDSAGVELSDLSTTRLPVHEILASLVAEGASAAAFVTHVPSGPERVLAQVLAGDPRDSDTRQAEVVRPPGSPAELGPWEYTV